MFQSFLSGFGYSSDCVAISPVMDTFRGYLFKSRCCDEENKIKMNILNEVIDCGGTSIRIAKHKKQLAHTNSMLQFVRFAMFPELSRTTQGSRIRKLTTCHFCQNEVIVRFHCICALRISNDKRYVCIFVGTFSAGMLVPVDISALKQQLDGHVGFGRNKFFLWASHTRQTLCFTLLALFLRKLPGELAAVT